MATKKKPARVRWSTPTANAVRAELRELEQRASGIAKSATAATAIALAKKLDHPDTTASAAATCTRVLLQALEQLHASAPAPAETSDTPEKPKDGPDEIAARREKRRAAARRSAT